MKRNLKVLIISIFLILFLFSINSEYTLAQELSDGAKNWEDLRINEDTLLNADRWNDLGNSTISFDFQINKTKTTIELNNTHAKEGEDGTADFTGYKSSDSFIKGEIPDKELSQLEELYGKGYTLRYRIKVQFVPVQTVDDGVDKVLDGDYSLDAMIGPKEVSLIDMKRNNLAWSGSDLFYLYKDGASFANLSSNTLFSTDTTNHKTALIHPEETIKDHHDNEFTLSGGDCLITSYNSDVDYFLITDMDFQFLVVDKKPPEVKNVRYFSSPSGVTENDIVNGYNEIARYFGDVEDPDAAELNYSGNKNSVYMAVEFNEGITHAQDITSDEYIATNMTIGTDGKGSFKYTDIGKNLDDTMVFKYEVNYGAHAKPEVPRSGETDYETMLFVDDLLRDLGQFSIKDDVDNSFSREDGDHKLKSDENVTFNNFECPNVRVDGDPPEIGAVEYEIIESDNPPYLKAGDIFEVRVKVGESGKVGDWTQDIYVNDGGAFFEFDNGSKASIHDRPSDGKYGYDDWIRYRYEVKPGDSDTTFLRHIISGSPDDGQSYYDQVTNMFSQMYIKDDYGNVARMFQTGEDRFDTMALPEVNDGTVDKRNIVVDTTPPNVNFEFESGWKNKHTIKVKPNDNTLVSGLKGDIQYFISKSSQHPTNGELKNINGLSKILPYQKGMANTPEVEIDDDLYLSEGNYSQYDEKYDPVTKEKTYENINFEDGSVTDVLYENVSGVIKREITGSFYIHLFMEDKAGNTSALSSTPKKATLDNTSPVINIYPNGTNKYVDKVNVEFDLNSPKSESATFDKYEYRWITPLDMDEGEQLKVSDMYNDGSYTYNILRDNHNDWETGNSLDSYDKSYIPTPSWELKEHGPNYLAIRAYDSAGNTSYIVSAPYYFDKKAPNVEFESMNDGFNNPLENHEIRVAAKDEDSKIEVSKYYFSNDNLTRDKNDSIWEKLTLELPDISKEEYDPVEGTDDETYEEYLLTPEAFLETTNWDKEELNGYAFLHIYVEDQYGNGKFYTQDVLLDKSAPAVKFEYDNAVNNRYKSVLGKVEITDFTGIDSAKYSWSSSTQKPSLDQYSSFDLSNINDLTDVELQTPKFTKDGEWYLHIKTKDKKGNVTEKVSNKYIIASDAPTLDLFNIDLKDKYITNQVSMPVEIQKTNDDGVEYTYVVYSDENYEQEIKRGYFKDMSELISINLDTSKEGQDQTFYIRLFNDLNIPTSNTFEVTGIYDSTKPLADISYNPAETQDKVGTDVVAQLTNISDNVSSSENIQISESSFSFSKNGEHIFKLTDQAGNTKKITAQVSWIADDKPRVRIDTDNTFSTPYKSINFSLWAERPTDQGFENISNPEIYYQIAETDTVDENNWIEYQSNEEIKLLKENYTDGEYYLITKLLDKNREFISTLGKFILDNTKPNIALNYSFDYENTDSASKSFTGTKEEYENIYGDISKITSDVTITVSFNEKNVEIQEFDSQVIDEVLNQTSDEKDFVVNENKTYTINFKDQAGNVDTKDISFDKLETVAKSSIFSISPKTFVNPDKDNQSDVTVTIDAPDGKQLDNIRYDGTKVDENNITFTTESSIEVVKAEFDVSTNGKAEVDVYNTEADLENTDPESTEEYNVTNIDKTAPTATFTVLDTEDFTKEVNIEISDNKSPTNITKVEFIKEDDSTINFNLNENQGQDGVIYNSSTNQITTSINGTVKYTFEDAAGNQGISSKDININTAIDLSNVEARYQVEGTTDWKTLSNLDVVNKNITAKLINIPQDYEIVNNFGSNTKTFVIGKEYSFLISNGAELAKFTIDLTDKIQKSGPQLNLDYTINSNPYEDELNVNDKTSKNVLLKITSSDILQDVFVDGTSIKNSGEFTYEFSENKIVDIRAIGEFGNETNRQVVMDWIDKDPADAGLFSLYTKPTNEDFIKLQFLSTRQVEILEINKDGSTYKDVSSIEKNIEKYEFDVDENGTYSVKYKDKIGNENIVNLDVDNFDRQAPNLEIDYNTTQPTKEDVIAKVKLVNPSDEPDGIHVINTIANTDEYLFRENGSFEFKVRDMAGNISKIEANVDNIDRTPPSYDVKYLDDNGDVLSDSEYTKGNVDALVTINENDPDYIILNRDIDQENPQASVNQSVDISGREINVEFDDNGYYRLRVSDQAGNKKNIMLKVKNIDRIPPTIEFKKDYLVTTKNKSLKLDDYIAFDTHSGDLNDQVSISNLDNSTEGIKTVTYSVSDEAGNSISKDRNVLVVGDNYEVVIDGEIKSGPFVAKNQKLDFKVFNLIEKITTEYIRDKNINGDVKPGDFKLNGKVYNELIDTDRNSKEEFDFSTDKTGWHTIYIQDQNRHTKLYKIYLQ